MSSVKRRPFCLSLNVSRDHFSIVTRPVAIVCLVAPKCVWRFDKYLHTRIPANDKNLLGTN